MGTDSMDFVELATMEPAHPARREIDGHRDDVRERQELADTGAPARCQRAGRGGQGPRDTKISFLTLARFSAPGHKPPLAIVSFLATQLVILAPLAAKS